MCLIFVSLHQLHGLDSVYAITVKTVFSCPGKSPYNVIKKHIANTTGFRNAPYRK